MTNSLVLITNSENQSFGTGFVIKKERNYSYILTCSHVVEDTPKSLLVDSVKAKIIYQGSSDGLDLAILKAQIDREPLTLMESDCDDFEIVGFKNFEKNNHILEPINCTLDTKVEFRPQSGESVSGWKLNIDKSDIIVGGYSGSPLICKESGKVVAVMSNRKGGRDGFAISIRHLRDIWEDMPRNLIKQKNYIPKIFISTAHREPDVTIATNFAKELNALGYRIFLAKTDISMGQDWMKQIDTELEKCDYFLLLLSKNSLESEMVFEEFKKIKELQNGSNFPAILPVRINLPFDDYNVNDNLLKQIDKIQQLVWKSEEDSKKIVKKIVTVISKLEPLKLSTEQDKVRVHYDFLNIDELEQPSGIVPLTSRNYIKRKDDEKCYIALRREYSLVTIKAPRQYGKSSLLMRLISKSEKENYHVVSFNFQEFDKILLNNLEELLEFICEMIAFELDIEVNLSPKILKRLTPKTKATKYMKKLLSKLNKPFVLAIDEADRLFEYSEVSNEFFGLIRAWYDNSVCDNSVSKTGWKNLKVLLSYSTDASFAITNTNQSPFNISNPIELKPFTKKELQDLVKKHGLEFGDIQLEKFRNFVGGHPYLSRKILHTMVSENQSFDEIVQTAFDDRSIFADHMRRYLWILKDNEKLMQVLKGILKGHSCNDDKSCHVLEATGLIKNLMNKPTFSCELYQEFFYKML